MKQNESIHSERPYDFGYIYSELDGSFFAKAQEPAHPQVSAFYIHPLIYIYIYATKGKDVGSQHGFIMNQGFCNHFQTVNKPLPSPVKKRGNGPLSITLTSCFEYSLPLSLNLPHATLNFYQSSIQEELF